VHPWLHTCWAPRAGVPWRLKMAIKWQYGLNSDRAVIMHETAQKRLRRAPVVSVGCPGMYCGVLGPTLTTYITRSGGLGTARIAHVPKCPKSTEL
jgi:hypothetical protein